MPFCHGRRRRRCCGFLPVPPLLYHPLSPPSAPTPRALLPHSNSSSHGEHRACGEGAGAAGAPVWRAPRRASRPRRRHAPSGAERHVFRGVCRPLPPCGRPAGLHVCLALRVPAHGQGPVSREGWARVGRLVWRGGGLGSAGPLFGAAWQNLGRRAGVQDRACSGRQFAPRLRCAAHPAAAAARRLPRDGAPAHVVYQARMLHSCPSRLNLPPVACCARMLLSPRPPLGLSSADSSAALLTPPAQTLVGMYALCHCRMQLIKDMRRLDTTPALNLVCMCVSRPTSLSPSLLHMLTCTAGLQQTAVGPLLTITAALCAPTAQLLGLLQMHQPGGCLTAGVVCDHLDGAPGGGADQREPERQLRGHRGGTLRAVGVVCCFHEPQAGYVAPSSLCVFCQAVQPSRHNSTRGNSALRLGLLSALLPVPPPLQYPSSTEIHNR